MVFRHQNSNQAQIVQTTCSPQIILLQMRNTSTEIPKRKNEQFITSKQEKNKHGLGLESVRRIVEKYEGCIDFEYDTTMFQVKILVAENS